ncbi:DUF7144 family membrane protein [Jiangella alkaliphila]|uniref:DUF7144 domain-containing protein n=1 Tax=Jiangella alkaliphila TaxID=419479 RepID=A0A1H2KXM7_9ACTN|nr:hypothetical protein [Jiangella alkaliphila]SDU73335.1 hypothetical protein SAMN04488563_4518 [Jiangella alkaliphila]
MTSIYEPSRTRAGSWAEAGLNFAATMMILLGMFQGLEGLTALIDENFYAGVPEYAYDISVGAWAWIHLIMALLLIIAGFALFAGSRVAAGVAMALAGLSAIAHFVFLPYYPVWSVVVIVLCVFSMWAIVRSGVFVR